MPDHAFSSWDAVAAAYRWQEPLESRSLDALVRLLSVAPGDLVVDVGAGPGTLTRRLRAAGPNRVVAVEPAVRMVGVGRFGGAGAVRGEATALPLPDAAVDIVTAGWLLHLLDPPARTAAVAECARVLRPGGRLGLVVPGEVTGTVRRVVRGVTRAAMGAVGASGPLSVPEDLDEALATAGLETVAEARTGRGYWARVVVARLIRGRSPAAVSPPVRT